MQFWEQIITPGTLSACLDTFLKAILAPKPRFHTKTSKHSFFLDKLFWEEKLVWVPKAILRKLQFSPFPCKCFDLSFSKNTYFKLNKHGKLFIITIFQKNYVLLKSYSQKLFSKSLIQTLSFHQKLFSEKLFYSKAILKKLFFQKLFFRS